MAVVLFALSILSFLVGFIILSAAAGSIHEILGTCMLIVAAILFSAGATVDAINRLRRTVERGSPPRSSD